MVAFDELAERYERLYRDNPAQVRAAVQLLELLPPAATVMDLGCGAARPVGAMVAEAGHHLHGYDVSEAMLALARKNCPTATFTHVDLRMIDGPPGGLPVDAVIAHLSLVVLSRAEIERTLVRMSGWLAPGGLLSLAMVDVDADLMPVLFLNRPLRISGWAGAALAAVVSEAGFDVIDHHIEVFQPQGRNPERQSFVLARARA